MERRKYPHIYPSYCKRCAYAIERLPIARRRHPVILVARGPNASRIAPTGRAETLAATAAMVNMRFNLHVVNIVGIGILMDFIVVPDLLPVANGNITINLILRTILSIYSFSNHDRFKRCISKHDAGGYNEINSCNTYLGYILKIQLVHRSPKAWLSISIFRRSLTKAHPFANIVGPQNFGTLATFPFHDECLFFRVTGVG